MSNEESISVPGELLVEPILVAEIAPASSEPVPDSLELPVEVISVPSDPPLPDPAHLFADGRPRLDGGAHALKLQGAR